MTATAFPVATAVANLKQRAGRATRTQVKPVGRWAVRHAAAGLVLRAAARKGEAYARLVSEPGLRALDHPFYDQLRAAGPVVPGRVVSVTARHDVAAELLRHPGFRAGFPFDLLPAAPRRVLAWLDTDGVATPWDPPAMLVSNGPLHERHRRIVSRAFTPRALEHMQSRVEHIAAELLEELAHAHRDGRPADLIAEYADVLPILVIAEILGVPTHLRSSFRRWANSVAAAGDLGIPLRTFRQAESCLGELQEWMRGHITGLRTDPGEDLLSRMIAAAADENATVAVDEHGLIANAGLLLVAGFETTVNLIGGGVDLLLRHPEQLRTLQSAPQGWANAVEEMLRLCPPVHYTFRHPAQDLDFHGTRLPAGRFVTPLIAAANRDPAVFHDPHRFDPTRPNARDHLSFGAGTHFCLGAALARMEATTGLRLLFDRFPDLQAVGPATPRNATMIAGIAQLPVCLGTAARLMDDATYPSA